MQTARKLTVAILALVPVLGTSSAHAQQIDLLPVREVPIGKVDPSAVEYSLVKSPDARHLAYVVKHSNGMAVIFDGRESQTYDLVQGPVLNESGLRPAIKFSQDGAHIAYVARNHQKSFLVVDGAKSGKEYDSIDHGMFSFSPNGKRIAFIARQAGKELVVVDGVESKSYHYIGTWPLEFSADSRHISFAGVLRYHHEVLVLDGKEIATADVLDRVIFSPDGKHWAYQAYDGTETVVIDGKPGKKYERVGEIIFSADSKHSLYSAYSAKGVRMVLDGVEQKFYPEISDDYVFGLNGQPEYRVELSPDSMILVTGKQESKPYDDISTPSSYTASPEEQWFFSSPDGKHVTFWAEHKKKEIMVHDGKESEAFDEIDKSANSPDGQKLFYSGIKEKKRYLVTNGNSMLLPDGITSSCMALSPGADHYAYCLPRDGKWYVAVDGKETASYDSVPTQFRFTSTGKLIYIASNAGKQFVVFDGAKGADYDKIYDIFSWATENATEKTLAYKAYRGDKVVIVFNGKESPAYDGILAHAWDKQESAPHFICLRGDQYLSVSVGGR